MHKNAIKKGGRVNFWKNIDYKKPETRPEPEKNMTNPTRKNLDMQKICIFIKIYIKFSPKSQTENFLSKNFNFFALIF